MNTDLLDTITNSLRDAIESCEHYDTGQTLEIAVELRSLLEMIDLHSVQSALLRKL